MSELLPISLQIESYLLSQKRWVPVVEICERFGIPERLLRADGRRRPIHSRFAITSQRVGENGLKHISCATIEERRAYKHAKLKTLIAYARAARDYNHALGHALSGKWPAGLTDLNGQGVLPV